ncbi:cell wall hydrolase/autolysin [Peptoclostridium acidaminophilum DSM 3953]|uniref:Cell wall hydrolase/autolysin n=1 Tax=Peptoclostridium acidaminophilum DSM 3953 TaxID=1286171 RepID=W8TM15_PEPAC|nr:N-acetylmuramoyl-L-alanine amidase [Peptoclostridium acidaminophilum]AHM57227.1 cell wall hydrolase/autolysin [Peptoclostridium acidaminophilum DSM 3953]
MYKICLDYGHGGTDPGAMHKGRKESDDNLSMGTAIAKDLRRHGIVVDETRTADVTVELRERSTFSNRGKYDYFISIHRNAFKPEMASGAETFISVNGNQKAKNLAMGIQRALVDAGFADRGFKAAKFHVLRETKAPAVLVEIGFVDNTSDNLIFDGKKEEIARDIAKAILDELGVEYMEEGSALKQALDILVERGLIGTPEYWVEHAKAGKTVNGEYAATLIERMAALLSK